MTDDDCNECKYAFARHDAPEHVECRRFPPQIFVAPDGDPAQGFPWAGQRCGEFTPLETPDALGA